MVSQSRARAAARAAAAMLAVAAGYEFYWSLGGTWAGGGEGPSDGGLSRGDTAVIGVVCLVFAGVLLVRVGYWHEHMPPVIVRFADLTAWVVVLVPLGGAVQSFALGYFIDGTFNLILAALAFVVWRSERPGEVARPAERFPGWHQRL